MARSLGKMPTTSAPPARTWSELGSARTSRQYRHGRATGLQRQQVDQKMTKVADLLANDQLPDVRVRHGRLAITPLRTTVPPEAEELGRRAYELLRWVRITDLLVEVDGMTGISRHFTHLQTGEPVTDPRALYTVLLAKARPRQDGPGL